MAYLIRSFKVAFTGILSFFRTERNGRIQGIIAIFVITAGLLLGISAQDWIRILGCIALVLCLEMVNSAIEKTCNLVSTDFSPAIKTIKDISAGAVLLAAIIAVIIGCIVFLPYLHTLL